LVRRHLDDGQRAMITAKISNLRRGTNQYEASKVDVPIGTSTQAPVTLEEAAKMMNVSVRSARRARAVLTHGAAALQQAVEVGDISVNAAAEIATDTRLHL